MNDEMFMKLLEMVQTAGQGGYVLALIYMFKSYFGALMLSGTVITIALVITRAINRFQKEVQTLKFIASDVGFSWRYDLSEREANELLRLVRERINGQQENQP